MFTLIKPIFWAKRFQEESSIIGEFFGLKDTNDFILSLLPSNQPPFDWHLKVSILTTKPFTKMAVLQLLEMILTILYCDDSIHIMAFQCGRR